MKPILQHINDSHNGNKAAFSRAVESSPTVTQAWLRKGFGVTSEGYIINPDNTKRDSTDSLCSAIQEPCKSFDKETLAETIRLIDSSDNPKYIDMLMSGKLDKFGDLVLLKIQNEILNELTCEMDSAIGEMLVLMDKQASIIDDLRKML